MIEERVISYLSEQLQLPVYAERPQDPDAEYILVERTGGSSQDHIRSATLAIQSCAASLYRAAEIDQSVEGAMEGITSLPNISRCELNNSYNFTDTESKTYRYQAVFHLVYM